MPRWLEPRHALRRRRAPWGMMLRGLGVVLLLAGATLVAARLDPLPALLTGAAIASDGDSLRLDGERIRLVGLDAPELDQVCWRTDGSEWPCGHRARAHLAGLLQGTDTTCRPEGEDKYGRLLARCTVDGRDLGAGIVEAGLAIADGGYSTEQSAARSAARGIWSGRFTEPRQWRREGPADDPGPGLMEQLWTWVRELTGARSLR